MRLNSLTIDNFRRIKRASLTFDEGINIFCGENAQGKTTILEAIYLFARGKSFRTVHDTELISFGAEYASATMTMDALGREYEMRMAYSKDGKRRCKRNDVELRRLSELIGTFRCVLFCPSHLSIVREGPAVRRSFVDVAISQLAPEYIVRLQRYSQVISQRNALLRTAYDNRGTLDATIEYWSSQVAQLGAEIAQERSEYISLLNTHAHDYLADMSAEKESLKLGYAGECDKDKLLKQLTDNLEREIRAGATMYGPHKDDLSIALNTKSARAYASQGQGRSIALALKLAERSISEEKTGTSPVLCLDDVLSELDESRRTYITSSLEGGQTFITTCDEIPLASTAKKFVVSGGGVIC